MVGVPKTRKELLTVVQSAVEDDHSPGWTDQRLGFLLGLFDPNRSRPGLTGAAAG